MFPVLAALRILLQRAERLSLPRPLFSQSTVVLRHPPSLSSSQPPTPQPFFEPQRKKPLPTSNVGHATPCVLPLPPFSIAPSVPIPTSKSAHAGKAPPSSTIYATHSTQQANAQPRCNFPIAISLHSQLWLARQSRTYTNSSLTSTSLPRTRNNNSFSAWITSID